MKRLLLTWIFSCFIVDALAITEDATRNPLGCRNSGYEFRLNTLALITSPKNNADNTFETTFMTEALENYPAQSADKQSLYFILNISNQPVHLSEMHPSDSEYSSYLNHTISQNMWSVLATNANEVNYICTLTPNNAKPLKVVPCRDYLRVCEYQRVRFGLNNRGNFWVVNSNTRGGAVAEVVHYGIIPQ